MKLVPAAAGVSLSALDTMYPSALEVVTGDVERAITTATTFGFVLAGSATVRLGALGGELCAGGYFCAPGGFSLRADGLVVLVVRHGYLGLPQLGAIEAKGRLAYIDGCSDSLLVSPPRLGDPAFNHLHFPAEIDQSEHLHPSIRLGVVARGRGFARLRSGEVPLDRGMVFLLDAHERHSFRTADAPMDVIAYHPDSDWGPTDAAHPMKTRTYLSPDAREPGR